MATLLESVGDYLAANGQGTLGTNLFLGRMLPTPDVCVAVFENQGLAPDFTMGAAATALDRPGLQVIVRASREDYPTARDKAQTIRLLLGGVIDQTISGVRILRMSPQGSVLPMGVDEEDRPLVSVNFRCVVAP